MYVIRLEMKGKTVYFQERILVPAHPTEVYFTSNIIEAKRFKHKPDMKEILKNIAMRGNWFSDIMSHHNTEYVKSDAHYEIPNRKELSFEEQDIECLRVLKTTVVEIFVNVSTGEESCI